MFKFFLFIVALLAVEAGASCGEDLSQLASRPEVAYPSGFTPPRKGSLGYNHLLMHNAGQVRAKRTDFERATLPDLISWLHSFSYTEATVTAEAVRTQNQGVLASMEVGAVELGPLMDQAITRLLAFDDEMLTNGFEELVAICANLSTTRVGFGRVVPLAERLARMSVARGDQTRRRALIDYLARYYLGRANTRAKFIELLPEWAADQTTDDFTRLSLLVQVIRFQLQMGSGYGAGFFGALVDELPKVWDSRLTLDAASTDLVRSTLYTLNAVGGQTLTPAQKARLDLLREAFPN